MSAEDVARCITAGVIGAFAGALVGAVFVSAGLLLARLPWFTRTWNGLVSILERSYARLTRFLRGGRR